MLLNVHIKNIALIEDANINFTDGLNTDHNHGRTEYAKL